MSWIDKELKKRVHAGSDAKMPADSPAIAAADHMAALWRLLDDANDALPPALKLAADHDLAAIPAYGVPRFLVWFKAPNGAGLGFTGDAIRYVWPERNERASWNFWICWTPDRGYTLTRRVTSEITGPKIVERSFCERRAGYMIKCLVVGRRITPRAVRKRRLWLF